MLYGTGSNGSDDSGTANSFGPVDLASAVRDAIVKWGHRQTLKATLAKDNDSSSESVDLHRLIV
jgi:hypothetical protein